MKGIIVKGIAGFYYVKTEGNLYQCKARGLFKKEGLVPTVGDLVEIEVRNDGDSLIIKIFDRKNIFIRPPIANVDCMVTVIAAAEPDPNFSVVDRFLVMAEKSHTEIVLCVNKIDLVKDNAIQKIEDIYSKIYPVYFVSAEKNIGIDVLKKALAGKKCALAGPSGAGKSTLLNALENKDAETGHISRKTKRGRHTTRHVEIFEMEYGGMIFDTPGFTSFDVLETDEKELPMLYPEMEKYLGKCKFDNCRHIKEPECAVRDAAKKGQISISRYRSYLEQMKDLAEREKNKY